MNHGSSQDSHTLQNRLGGQRIARSVGRALKDASRIRQITLVFGKYGFEDFFSQMGMGGAFPLSSKLFSRWGRPQLPAEILTKPSHERLRMALEELGPTFIKLGQMLSTRTDLFPEETTRELARLRDEVAPCSFAQIRSIVEQEMGRALPEVFATFSERALAAASIGQVHEATLLDGTAVVVKVRRPGIEATLQADWSALSSLAVGFEKYFPEYRTLAPRALVDVFFQSIHLELNFLLEVNNLLLARENLGDFPEIQIPRVEVALCTERLLVSEKVRGIRATDCGSIPFTLDESKKLTDRLAEYFLQSVLEKGFFHCDLHPGNVFLQKVPRGEGAVVQQEPHLGIIDYGMVGHLSMRSRESLLRIFYALASKDYESLCMEYAELGAMRGKIDFESYLRDVQNILHFHLGRPHSSIEMGKVLLDAVSVSKKHQIHIPRDWLVVFRAIYTLEGTCRRIFPGFDPIPLLESKLENFMKPEMDQISKEFLLGSRELQSAVQLLPRQMNLFFRRFAANGYALEVKNPQAELDRKQSERNSRELSSAIFSAGLILAATALAIYGWERGLRPSLTISGGLFLFAFALRLKKQ